MGRVRVVIFSVSIDGFGAGPDQSLEHPLGLGGRDLHTWFYPTRTFRAMIGQDGGTTGPDDDFARASTEGFGAVILGRNMFGPVRGAWPDEAWQGWWGDNPPFHAPVFVLTHHARPAIELNGGTTFHFVTEGIEAALTWAKAAAGDLDVKISGGVSTIRQYLLAGAIDELHLVVSPVLLGSGEALFAGIDLPRLGYRVTDVVQTGQATHLTLTR